MQRRRQLQRPPVLPQRAGCLPSALSADRACFPATAARPCTTNSAKLGRIATRPWRYMITVGALPPVRTADSRRRALRSQRPSAPACAVCETARPVHSALEGNAGVGGDRVGAPMAEEVAAHAAAATLALATCRQLAAGSHVAVLVGSLCTACLHNDMILCALSWAEASGVEGAAICAAAGACR